MDFHDTRDLDADCEPVAAEAPRERRRVARRGIEKGALDVPALARQHAESAIAVLADIMEDPTAPHASRISAASAILDRAFGKPAQSHVVDSRLSLAEEFEDLIGKLGRS